MVSYVTNACVEYDINICKISKVKKRSNVIVTLLVKHCIFSSSFLCPCNESICPASLHHLNFNSQQVTLIHILLVVILGIQH